MRGLTLEELWQLSAVADAAPGDHVYVSARIWNRLQARGLVGGSQRGGEWHPHVKKLGRWLRRAYATGQLPLNVA